jgi:hypothetical protein
METSHTDVIIRLRGVRPGDDYWEATREDGVVATAKTFLQLVTKIEASGLTWKEAT